MEKKYDESNDGTVNTKAENMIAALEKLKGAFIDVTFLWCEHTGVNLDDLNITTPYPFHMSFDELAYEVCAWADDAVNQLKTVQDNDKIQSEEPEEDHGMGGIQ